MKLLHTEYLKNVPPELMEELKTLEAHQDEYLKMHAQLQGAYVTLRQNATNLAERLQPYCHCPKCRPAKTVKSDAERGAAIQNVITVAALIFLSGFVIGWICG